MPGIDADRACSARFGAGDDFTLPGAERHYPPDLELEPIHLDIALTVDIDAETAAGTVTHTVLARRDGVSRLRLHAVQLLGLDVADADGGTQTSSYDGRELVVDWAEPFARGEQRR